MFFKNLAVIALSQKPVLKDLAEKLYQVRFTPLTALEVVTAGWDSVMGYDGYIANDHMLMKLVIEKKTLPSSAVKVRLAEVVEEVAKAQSFHPGRKQTRELKDGVIDELLPRALPSRRATHVWVDANMSRLYIDTASASVVDLVMRMLLKAGVDVSVPTWPSNEVMTALLEADNDPDFSVDDYIEMFYPQKDCTVRYKGTKADNADVRQSLADGAVVTALGMTHQDTTSFVLKPHTLTKVKLLDTLKSDEKDVDGFDSDFAYMTTTLREVVADICNLS
jgi:recombination associated protein RdgC